VSEVIIKTESGHADPSKERTLRSMFEDRKSVFVDLLKWDVPVLGGRFELDEFDDERATYIIVADCNGDHRGSARLLPTTGRHILGSLFAGLCNSPPLAGPDVFEITRFCLSRRQNAECRRRTRNQLVSALTLYALQAGIKTYTGVAELQWLQQILAFGWECRPLGAPQRLDCGLIGALAIDIGPDTPGLLALNNIWDDVGEPAIAQAA
jgi:acyl-homoserine lactone synthase